MSMTPGRMIEGLGQMIDRPLPRGILAVAAVGVLEGGIYGAHAAFDETLADRQADIEACAAHLEPDATHFRSAELPAACDTFRTSFSYADMTVIVVHRGNGGDVQVEPAKNTRTYFVPPAAEFRREQEAKAADELKYSSTETQIAISLAAIGGIFGVFSMIAHDRRKKREQEDEAQESPEAA